MTSRIVGITAIVALSAAGSAMGSTISGLYNGGINSGLRQAVPINAGGFQVGALTHTWSSGVGALAAYNGVHASFCIDNQTVSGTTQSFSMFEVTNAPVPPAGNFGNPGFFYTPVQRQRLNAVALAARDAGYLNSLGFFANPAQIGAPDISSAIQLLVWESVWEPTAGAGWNMAAGTFTGAPSANIQSIFNTLATAATTIYNDANTQILVRTLSTTGGQDQMVLIPLPPAAWAGLSTLAGVGFVGYVRRRKNAAQ